MFYDTTMGSILQYTSNRKIRPNTKNGTEI